MISRREFIKLGVLLAASTIITWKIEAKTVTVKKTMKNGKIKKALVIWYSQTGNTAKIGNAIAAFWKSKGLSVESGDYREIDSSALGRYDIIAVGTPIFYLDVPENLRQWLKSIPDLEGTPVVPFVTFGGEGGNQKNTMFELAELLASKGGVPVGTMGFSGMSTYAITWSMGNGERTLEYKTLPDENSRQKAGDFAQVCLDKAVKGVPVEINDECSVSNLFKGNKQIILSKLMTTGHGVDREKCIGCGTCVRVCPVGAIDPAQGSVDGDSCILCLGCINNCPTNAVTMKFLGNEIYGYREFVRRNNLNFREG